VGRLETQIALNRDFVQYIEDDDVLFFTGTLSLSAINGHVFGLASGKLVCAETFWRQDVTWRSQGSSVHEED
jgi:hypothetical protein